MSTQYQKLLSLLKELFQTDQAELDFGMYRVINQRRDEINRFLDEELLPQVKMAFSEYQSLDKQSLEADLEKAVKSATELGVDPEAAGKVKQIREQIATYSVDVDDLENQVYSALFNFFRRYYDKGDFISQRRYKEGVYAIPYEGEEVKLHWANHDQYYIKTSEYLRDYAFKLPSGNLAHFKLVEADTEKDNRKETDDKKRRFILAEESLAFENGEIAIRFEFRPDDGKLAQKKLNEQAVETIFSSRKQIDEQAFKDALAEFATPAPTESDKNRTLFAKYLEDYTRRNTQDYFIHKDLGKFLRLELDFFIKNEIMHLDNIEHETAPKVESYLSKIKVIRQIAHKLIDFISQIEDFQKKLWLKKKFVVETHYCITLDRVPEELYPKIAKNDAQREEWVHLFAIDEIKGDMFKVAYSTSLTIDFLKANPFLLVDTKFFDNDFKYRLLASFDSLDEEMDGLLVHSENFQALKFLESRYKESVCCVYIDPPYNTAASEILYKNDYKHSSWLCLMHSRIQLAKTFMKEDSIICVAIDDFELPVLSELLADVFGDENHLATITIRSNPHGRAMAKGFSTNHEYALFFSKTSLATIGRIPRDENRLSRYPHNDENGIFTWINFRGTGANTRRIDRPKLFYPIFIAQDGTLRVPKLEWNEIKQSWITQEKPKPNEINILPIDSENQERVWSLGSERATREIKRGDVVSKQKDDDWKIYRKYRPNQEGAVPGTWWHDAKYSSTESGTKILKELFGQREVFSYPKSIYLLEDSLRASNFKPNEIVLDFFVGSGTTGHAVININRCDNGKRKFILVEMGQYFYTALKPRIQKVIYSEEWKDGKPVSRKGSSHAFKYIKLESYEDTLNNLDLKRIEEQGQALLGAEAFREDYLLRYMLDIESKESLLDLKIFETPFDYQLKIASSTVGETTPTKVDLVETFNYLIGLQVHTIRKIDGVVLVEGQTLQNEKVLVIWRNTNVLDNDLLNTFFTEQFAVKQKEFHIIYVNGDNTLANIRPQGVTWKVHLIEEEFHYRMFEAIEI